jgi:hypothetical protein
MTTDRERGQIRAAMGRLLAGTPLRSDGALTVVSLAIEADVKRHVLTHRHTDLKDEFYARVRAQGHVPASEQELRDELKTTKQKLAEAREKTGSSRNLSRRSPGSSTSSPPRTTGSPSSKASRATGP